MIEEVEGEEDNYKEDDIGDLAVCITRLNEDQREHLLMQMIREDADF
jgi:DNA-directed RNA polymerase specialized sigma24 family protein